MIERYRDHPRVFAFLRAFGTATAVVLLNFGEDNDVSLEVVGFVGLALDNYRDPGPNTRLDREVLQGSVVLRGYQGKIFVKQWIYTER
jgi:hypothetical protein